jgi:hypothetical protein
MHCYYGAAPHHPMPSNQLARRHRQSNARPKFITSTAGQAISTYYPHISEIENEWTYKCSVKVKRMLSPGRSGL